MTRTLVVTLAAFAAAADAPPRAGRAESVRGTVAAVRPEAKQFTLTTESGETLEFTADAATRVRVGGAGDLGRLREGDRVRVRYRRAGGENRALVVRQAVDAGDVAAVAGEVLKLVREATRDGGGDPAGRLRDAARELEDRADDLADDAGARAAPAFADARGEFDRARARLDRALGRMKDAPADARAELRAEAGDALEAMRAAHDRMRDAGRKGATP